MPPDLTSPIPRDPLDAVRPTRLPADVPSDQLWHEAILATRSVASAAAELRLAIQASRDLR